MQLSRPPLLARIGALAWRVAVLGLLVALPIGGFYRLLETGPGPDLPTTLRWMAFGDDGRAAELVTIHRAFEVGSAAARFAVREFESPPFEGDWETALAPFSTMMVRGWIPLLFVGASTDTAPEGVREFYRIRAVDGWGRPYRVGARLLERGGDWGADPEIAGDMERGLNQTFFTRGRPDFEAADWLRLTMVSSGADGVFDSDDDIRMISYVAAGFTFHLSGDQEELNRRLDEAFFLGRHFFNFEGATHDLIDARLLAEFRMERLS